jgi:arsenite methyltransferase
MKRRADYGIDGPGLVIGFVVVGLLLALVAGWALGSPTQRLVPVALSAASAALAALSLAYAAVMLSSSLVGKRRVRDRLVAALALSEGAHVLDAGCGRGLALIGCAKQLTSGKAVGVDLWSARDLSDNNPAATRANAAVEGVADRIEVHTGDIRRLPFADAAFDAIISMTVIHNIASREGRDQAIGELVRVLKPGGRVAIFDLVFTRRYAELFRRAGLEVQRLGRHRLWLFPGESLLAQKPGP